MEAGTRERTQKEWISEYEGRDAYWAHDGNPERKHAVLTSGMHSSGFFNSRLVIKDPALLREMASAIVTKIFGNPDFLNAVDRVVGPETGATKLAEAVAAEIGRRRGFPCKWASPKKREDKSLYFDEGQERVEADEIVLLVEDVVSTGGSVGRAAQLCMDAGATPMGQLGCIVNRSGDEKADGRELVALVTKAMPMWEPNACPLCAVGSEAVRPKDNWAELTAKE